MADQRNPSGRRPPALPLPPPPEDLPRLPEVNVDDSAEVHIDHRVLAPNRHSLSGAREVPRQRNETTRVGRPGAERTLTPPSPRGRALPDTVSPPLRKESTRPPRGMHTPTAPPRSAAVRVTTAQHSSLIGGRYQIVKRIGQGGMGKVYEVNHIHLSRRFALKIISNTVAETDEARELFYREARFASAMSHPNITSVVDFGEDEKVGMFMVMEFVDGEPLHRILFREKRLSVRKACEIVLQVAEALHYIHKQNVVHCDIKTENILIGEEEGEGKRTKMVAKLLDFGLARPLSGPRASTSLSGTPHYVAPERIRGEPASPASDVYGVGILLYELITGQVPWDGPVQKILAGHLDEVPKSPSKLVENLDPAVENLVLHALAKRPAERHKDMAAFIYELKTVMDMLGIGRRRGAGGPSRRVVIEQKSPDKGSKRDELARIAFDACRLPLALLTPSGQIAAANPAFAKFVMGVTVEVEGLQVKSTALANAWSTAEQDIARTLAGSPIRRIIEIDVSPEETRRLLLWLDAVSQDHVV
ncbi:MAG TPA: serine/threonine-protein kinase, partial [Kofleriaceae bacterium]|nr:serine/threonine-protein kinase [Kofleriaceae bacterium]